MAYFNTKVSEKNAPYLFTYHPPRLQKILCIYKHLYIDSVKIIVPNKIHAVEMDANSTRKVSPNQYLQCSGNAQC